MRLVVQEHILRVACCILQFDQTGVRGAREGCQADIRVCPISLLRAHSLHGGSVCHYQHNGLHLHSVVPLGLQEHHAAALSVAHQREGCQCQMLDLRHSGMTGRPVIARLVWWAQCVVLYGSQAYTVYDEDDSVRSCHGNSKANTYVGYMCSACGW